jgi:hypothetical protein
MKEKTIKEIIIAIIVAVTLVSIAWFMAYSSIEVAKTKARMLEETIERNEG